MKPRQISVFTLYLGTVKPGEDRIEVLHARCKVLVACQILTLGNGTTQKETRTFGTMTGELLQLLDWLVAAGCTHAMESTGEYGETGV